MSDKPFKFPLENQPELFPDLLEDRTPYMHGNFEDTLGHYTPSPPNGYAFDKFMSQPEDGLVSEVHIKYYKKDDGNMKIVTVKRKFYDDNDYIDSYYSEFI